MNFAQIPYFLMIFKRKICEFLPKFSTFKWFLYTYSMEKILCWSEELVAGGAPEGTGGKGKALGVDEDFVRQWEARFQVPFVFVEANGFEPIG